MDVERLSEVTGSWVELLVTEVSLQPCSENTKHESVPTPSSSLSLDGHYAAQLALTFGNLLG